MFMKIYHFSLIFVLILGTGISVSSSSWLMAWFGLEMNLMAFIPLLIFTPSPSSSEASISYFLTQALASLIIIFMGLLLYKMFSFNSFDTFNMLITFSLGVKAGMAPTHFWFPQVMELINWLQSILLLTWQKIAPLVLMFSAPSFLVSFIFIIASCLFGCLGGFNINSLKKIMAYSSISHLAWMGTSILISMKMWLIYFSVYSFIIVSVTSFFWVFSINLVNSIPNVVSNKLSKMFIIFNILSMGGMPPFLGIFPKIMVIYSFSMFSAQGIIIILALITSSVVTLFFYVKIIYSLLLLYNFKSSPNTQNLKNFPSLISLFITCSLLGNMLVIPLISVL